MDGRKDDPQAIFESLNDKGMPLQASELICSYLFKPLESVTDFEQLHNMQWLQAIRQFEKRDHFEEYLRHLFSIGERKMVGKGRKIYVHFKNKNKPLNVATARHRLEEIFENADLYRHIVTPVERPHPDVDIRSHLIAISNTRMDSCTPFLLDLLRTYRSNVINKEKTIRLMNELTTLLVRRKMTERPTTVYDTMFPRLFSMIAGEPDPVRAMQDQFRKNNVWVSDQEFKESLVERTLYRTRDLIFTRMVLMEIDRTMQTHGQYPDYSTVETIEHVIPQTLDGHWKEYLGADCDNSKFETIINSLGNLCLLSGPANSSASQNPFRAKAIQYSEITALARELKKYEGDWNLAAVTARSERLADKALVRWAWTL